MPNRSDELARLMQRYRVLCEATGIARANGIPMAAAAQGTLADLERRILAFAGPIAPASEEYPADPVGVVPDRELPRPSPTPVYPSPVPPVSSTGSDDLNRERRPSGDRPTKPAQPSPKSSDPNEMAKRETTGSATGTSALVYTDGSAEGNPGPGGYCALIRMPDRPDRELSGGTLHTTNNKMELTAAIVGLRTAFDAGASDVTVYSDSEYVIKGMTEWLSGWKRKRWQTSDGQPVKNRELWEQLAQLVEGRTVRWRWVKGHAGHPENERCDQVATAAARRAAKSRSA